MRPMLHHLFKTLVTVLAVNATVAADAPTSWGQWTTWGDQGDGPYRNPVLPSDYSDLDCIRVASDYYAISSTMQFSPGMVTLHSRDLVNWQILGHVVTNLNQIGPELNWDRMKRYGRGVWAGANRTLEFRLNGVITSGPLLTNHTLWLKSTWGLDGPKSLCLQSRRCDLHRLRRAVSI